MHSDQNHYYCVFLSLKVKVIAKIKVNALENNKHTTQKQKKQEICPVIKAQLMCQIFMNDLLTKQGQQRSRVITSIIDTTQRSLANRNQIQLTILELSDLRHRIGSFSTTQCMRK